MSDQQKTIEVLLRGRNELGPAFTAAGASARTFADQTVGSAKRALDAVLNLQNLIVAGAAAVAARAVFKPAIDIENARNELEILLGSADAAVAKLRELQAFAGANKLDDMDVERAYKMLYRLTDGALTGKDSLRMIADVAAYARRPVADLGETIGRLYGEIKAGDTGGRAVMELTKMGVFSKQTAVQIEALTKAGASSRDVWAVVTAEFARYNGALDKTRDSTSRNLVAIEEAWEDVRATVGEAALPALNKAINDIVADLEKLRASGELQKWGEAAGAAITKVYGILKALATFVADNHEALTTLGFTYVGYRTIMALATAVTTVNAALAIYKTAQAGAAVATAAATAAEAGQIVIINAHTRAMAAQAVAAGLMTKATVGLAASVGVLGVALTSLGALAVVTAGAALLGYKLGDLAAGTHGVADTLNGIAEARALAERGGGTGLEDAQKQWLKLYGSLEKVNGAGRNFSAWWRWVNTQQAAGRAPKPPAPEPPADDGLSGDRRVTAEQKAAATKAEAERKKIEEDLIAARQRLADLDAEAAQDAADKKIEAEVKAFKDEENAFAGAAAQHAARMAELQKDADALRNRLLHPDQARADDAAAKKAAGEDKKLKNETADAYRRLADLGGNAENLDDWKLKGRLSKHAKDLIKLDREQKDAENARMAAQEANGLAQGDAFKALQAEEKRKKDKEAFDEAKRQEQRGEIENKIIDLELDKFFGPQADVAAAIVEAGNTAAAAIATAAGSNAPGAGSGGLEGQMLSALQQIVTNTGRTIQLVDN